MHILTFDTETIGLPPKNFVYDIGWCIHDRKGEIIKERSFAVREVITNGELMTGAFFAKKIFSHYIPALYYSNIRLLPFAEIAEIMRGDMRFFEVQTLAAYNLQFDMRAMKRTAEDLQIGQVLEERPKNILDIWLFACLHLFSTPTYYKVAENNGWISEAGNYRTTAEHAYRFISGNDSFDESHTGIEDARIEAEILAACFAKRKRIPYNDLQAHPWRLAQPTNRTNPAQGQLPAQAMDPEPSEIRKECQPRTEQLALI